MLYEPHYSMDMFGAMVVTYSSKNYLINRAVRIEPLVRLMNIKV